MASVASLVLLMSFSIFASPPWQSMTPVPYFGAQEPYFLGNGIVGGGGDTHGRWDFLIGPDYTSPNFIASESLVLIVDGEPVSLQPEMHRARKSGVFVGSQTIGECLVTMADCAANGMAWASRIIRVSNRSKRKAVRIEVRAQVLPASGTGFASEALNGSVLRIAADTNAFCCGSETKNWEKRSSSIFFGPASSCTQNATAFELSCGERTIEPGKSFSTDLYHVQSYGDGQSLREIDSIRERNSDQDLGESLKQWTHWLRGGANLETITDPKARDVVEGCLVACKMQQDRDGGLIAGARKYANSYVRDTHGGVRLFIATGHIAEAKKAIETIMHKWSVGHFIPNYWSMGSDAFIGRSFSNDDSEITAYFVLMVRDYLVSTRDRGFLDRIEPVVKFAVNAQLDYMSRNGWRITFNGDETEQYCVKKDGEVYGGFPAFEEWSSKEWSFPSAALACASTRFYIDVLRQAGRISEATLYEHKLGLMKNAIDQTFLGRDQSPEVHCWKRNLDGSWPTSTVTNYDLIPLWAGAKLNEGREKSDALAMISFLNPVTGILPTAPPFVTGYCGHNLGYLLYDLAKLGNPAAKRVYETMISPRLIGCWGTVSEFYGPLGTPNGHNFRVFESGIDAESIVRYFEWMHRRSVHGS